MLLDETGNALPEYAIVLSAFSIVAFLALVGFCTIATNTVQHKITAMSGYQSDPSTYENLANGDS